MGGLTYTTGKNGQAFNLNGTNSYIEYGDKFDIGLSSWTYSIWYYSTDSSFDKMLFSKSAPFNEAGRFGLYNSGSLIRFFMFVSNSSYIDIRDNSTVMPGFTWVNITVVIDRSDKIKIYYNGVLSTNIVDLGNVSNNLVPYASNNLNNARPFRLGCYTTSDGVNHDLPTWFIKGRLDEFNIWNRALTASEVAQIYNSGSGKFYPY